MVRATHPDTRLISSGVKPVGFCRANYKEIPTYMRYIVSGGANIEERFKLSQRIVSYY
ncbi:hypothetical protein C8K15_109106 [Paenisporosarcina sp. OV554]|nr:hypothetical protein C8K15_109106 [Paenisporosarcina sp. OV554]